MSSHPSTPARAKNHLLALILGVLTLPGTFLVLYNYPATGGWIRHHVTLGPSSPQAPVPTRSDSGADDQDRIQETREAPSVVPKATRWIATTNSSSSNQTDSLLESDTLGRGPTATNQTNPAPSLVKLPVLRLESRFGIIEGIPIARFVDEVWMLQSNGAIQQAPTSEIVDEQVLPKEFAPATPSEIAAELRREFGGGFQVRWEQPYFFVSRTKGSAFWGEKFRGLQASMKQFCRSEGVSTRELSFPLVVVILGSRSEFRQYCQTHQISVPETCVGVYSQKTNRIALFEDSELSEKQNTIDTICHEAAHQLAFNFGLHQRCAATPLWLAEGFATMFEAPRYAQPMNQNLSSWPTSRKAAWIRLSSDPARTRILIEDLLKNDKLFEERPEDAYALAWGLAHFLSNNHSKSFSQYLRSIGQLEPFLDPGLSKRLEMFRQFFGSDTSKLTNALIRHIESLR